MKPLAAGYIFTIVMMSAEIGYILTKGNRSRQTFSFVICQILLNIWSAAQLFQLEAVTQRQLFLSYCVGNTGICFIGTAWLYLSFCTSGRKLPKYAARLMIVFSGIMWLFAMTNPLHRLFYSSFSIEGVEHGLLFYINIFYTYFCIIFGSALICRSISGDTNRRRQILLLSLSAIIPLVSNMLHLTGIAGTGYDITPLAFSVSSVLVLLATNRFGFLNVKELAFDRALESISEGVAVFGSNGRMTFSNETFRKFFGECSIEELNGIMAEHSGNSSESSDNTEINMDGRIISLKQYFHKGKNSRTLAVTVIASDITRYYEMARQKQALSEAREKLAVERERNRIAQEVHDTAGHTLTMITSLARLIDVSSAKGDNAAVQQYAKEAQQLSSQGIAQLRISINNLRRRSENSLITEGLEQLVSSVRGIKVELCIQGEDSMKYSFCSNVIYENTREAITNCVKYSGADRMDIIVKLLPDSVEVYIMDNGCGCTDIVPGNGLKGMQERTEKAGGTIKFSSPDGCGFSIFMKFHRRR